MARPYEYGRICHQMYSEIINVLIQDDDDDKGLAELQSTVEEYHMI